MIRLLATTVLALGLAAPALAAPSEFTRHLLTVPAIEKHQAATRELEKTIKKKDDDNDDKDGLTVDELTRELDATPGVRQILARHGMTSRSYALTTMALLEAGLHVMLEAAAAGKKVDQPLASYPAEMRANIELLRKHPQLLKK